MESSEGIKSLFQYHVNPSFMRTGGQIDSIDSIYQGYVENEVELEQLETEDRRNQRHPHIISRTNYRYDRSSALTKNLPQLRLIWEHKLFKLDEKKHPILSLYEGDGSPEFQIFEAIRNVSFLSNYLFTKLHLIKKSVLQFFIITRI